MSAWLLFAALQIPGASDDVGPVVVATEHCSALDADEVARLLAIELADVVPRLGEGPGLRIELRCAAPILGIAIVDPITDKRMSRDVPLPADEPGRERVIALATAQLFAASWLELLLPTPAPAATIVSEPRPRPEAVDAARTTAATALGRPRLSLAILLAPLVRGRGLERSPFAAFGGELDVRPWFGPAGIVVRLGVEGTRVRREFGTVRAWMASLGLGVATRLKLSSRWQLGAVAVVSGSLGRLRGLASRPDVPTGAITAATGQIALGMGPRLRLGSTTMLELDAELGGTLRAPEGLVAGAAPVSLGGLWAGGALRVGFEWTPRGRARQPAGPG